MSHSTVSDQSEQGTPSSVTASPGADDSGVVVDRPRHRSIDRSAWFAYAAVAIAAIALVVTAVGVARSAGDREGTEIVDATDTPINSPLVESDPVDLDDGAVADPDVDPIALMGRAAEAMAGVTSVEFRLQRDGSGVFIDQFEEIALDSLRGQFTVPTKAQAELTVTIDDDLTTKIGAVAIDDEVWISNPVTGDFETLPAGYDIDPSRFFDPQDGWQPLITNLRDVELIEIDDRGGDRYRVRGLAPAADVRNITVDLIRNQDVPIDFWIHPTTALVTAAEFTTVVNGADAFWVLELDNYGDTFTIAPPQNVRNQ